MGPALHLDPTAIPGWAGLGSHTLIKIDRCLPGSGSGIG